MIGPLEHIFQISLSEGIVPKKMKIAIITPIFKATDITLVENYRPISALLYFTTKFPYYLDTQKC